MNVFSFYNKKVLKSVKVSSHIFFAKSAVTNFVTYTNIQVDFYLLKRKAMQLMNVI